MSSRQTVMLFLGVFWLAAFPGGSGAGPSPLLGSWQCGEASLVFRSETLLVYDGEQLLYQRRGNVLRVQDEEGVADYSYALSGKRLALVSPDGERIECVKSGSAPAARGAQEGRTPGAGGGAEHQLRGMLCQWSGSSGSSSSYSRSTRVSFDGAGRFTYGTESSFSGGAGMAYGGGPAEGGTYRVDGDVVHLAFSDGSRGTARVKMRQNSGAITELLYDGDLYARSLCD